MTASDVDELPPNFEFGGYVIRECIGRGGMAHVYRAEQAALHRPVALKVLDRWVLEKPRGSERFLREARTAAAIKHPNVVDIVDVGVWQERPYIVMELLGGSDLEKHLARHGTLSDTEVASLALPIIAGMTAVHEAGIVHRDLKPGNIFLANGADGEVTPKVLDFGVSKYNDPLHEPLRGQTKTREIIGTPTYMAPEALNGVRELGPRADQYALGAILYECLVGRPPFEGETLLELLKAIAVGQIVAPRTLRPEISIALEDAILRAMNSNPQGRFDTLRDFGRALWPLADERSRTIWARSFGNGRPTLGGGSVTGSSSVTGTVTEPRLGLVLMQQPKDLEETPEMFPERRPLRQLAALAAFVAVGALAGVYVLGPWSPAPEAEGLPSAAHSPSSVEGAPPAGLAERRSLLSASDSARGDSSRRDPASPESSAQAAGEEEDVGAPTGGGSLESAASEPRTVAKRAPARPRASRSAAQRTARSSATASRKKRPSSATESELEGLFEAPGSAESGLRSASLGDAHELDGLFPRDEAFPLGPNGAPLPD